MLILLPMFVKVGILVQQPFHIKSPHFAGVGVVGRPEINLSRIFSLSFTIFTGVTPICRSQIAESFEGHH